MCRVSVRVELTVLLPDGVVVCAQIPTESGEGPDQA